MNLASLVSSVQRVLKDPAILRSTIVEELNLQLRIATARVHIPNLIHSGKITLPAGVIAGRMPDDYQHSLLSAYSETTDRWLTIRTDRKALYDDYTLGYLFTGGLPTGLPFLVTDASKSNVGPIEEIAVGGALLNLEGEKRPALWARPATSQQETIQVSYYRLPANMSDDADVPDGIPEENQRNILVSGTLVEKLPESSLEAGLIEKLLALHAGRYATGMTDLLSRYPFAPKHTPKPRRRVREF